jgi:hypothetical protein
MFDGAKEIIPEELNLPKRPDRKTTTPIRPRNYPSRVTQRRVPKSFRRTAAELSLITALPFAGLAGAAAVDHNIADVPFIDTAHADIESAKVNQRPNDDMIQKGAHPQKYSNEGVIVVPLGKTKETKPLPNTDAELSVYKNYALDRMLTWTGASGFQGEEKEDFNRSVFEMRRVIEGNPSFQGMKDVTRNHANDLVNFANKHNVPPEIVLSMALIENGGAEGMVSPAGARGVLQVMPDLLAQKLASRNLTLDYFNKLSSKDQDAMLIDFGVENIADMYKLFDDWGLAIWAHHGGQGNVYQALKVYFNEKYDANNLPPGGYVELRDMYKKLIGNVKKHGFNFYVVLQNPRVKKEVLEDLEDETDLYTIKTIAANIIINEYLTSFIENNLRRPASR